MKNITTYAILYFFLATIIISCKTNKEITLSKEELIHQYMITQRNEIQHEIPNAIVTLLDDSIKVLFRDGVFFNSGSFDLKPESIVNFKKFSRILNRYPKTTVLFSGYTDNQGTDKANYELSSKRANSARDIVVTHGVEPSRLFAFGMGKRYPISDNNTLEGRGLNRRIEIIILYDDK